MKLAIMTKKTHIKAGIAIVLITVVAYALKMVHGWETIILGLLLTLGFYFHLHFIKYVDEQKKETSGMHITETSLRKNSEQ